MSTFRGYLKWKPLKGMMAGNSKKGWSYGCITCSNIHAFPLDFLQIKTHIFRWESEGWEAPPIRVWLTTQLYFALLDFLTPPAPVRQSASIIHPPVCKQMISTRTHSNPLTPPAPGIKNAITGRCQDEPWRAMHGDARGRHLAICMALKHTMCI